MSHHTWNYQNALRRAGYRVTPQRELIMDLVCCAEERPTAQDLCDRAGAASPGLSPATVYRNLRFLTEQRLLRAVEHEGRTRYELAGPDASHHHLVCTACGREREIPEEACAAFYAHVERAYGFRIDEDHLVLRGRCAACRDEDGR